MRIKLNLKIKQCFLEFDEFMIKANLGGHLVQRTFYRTKITHRKEKMRKKHFRFSLYR